MAQKRKENHSEIAVDATAAAVHYIMEHFDMLPADKGRIAAFFGDVINEAIESAILLDRRERLKPSNN